MGLDPEDLNFHKQKKEEEQKKNKLEVPLTYNVSIKISTAIRTYMNHKLERLPDMTGVGPNCRLSTTMRRWLATDSKICMRRKIEIVS